ncbi:AAA family ATPase [Succinivibrio dextrinosolvens]|uniref:AAA family ATPase n=1 Tax=Succinivibrio dextrinosolvens TaxID=83771 RepID=UPI0019246EBA|nr:ATP-binding protein [Succinivibrio dextrinosolvens]
MSTEICINYSDEIIKHLSESSDIDDSSYSSMGTHEQADFKQALSGNVNMEYLFAAAWKNYERGQLEYSLGDLKTLKKEALLDHSARAHVPDALTHNAFINYFGGMATVPNRMKSFNNLASAILQGNYNAVGLLHDDFSSIKESLIAAYNLEFLINSRAKSLYETFYKAVNDKSYESLSLSKNHHRKFYDFVRSHTADDLRLKLIIAYNRGLILKLCESFSLGCIRKIEHDMTPDEADTSEFLHFVKCFSILWSIRKILEREFSRGLVGNLKCLLNEIKESSAEFSITRDMFDGGLKIVIARIFLENYDKCSAQNDIEELKELTDKVIQSFGLKKFAFLKSSPYVLRLIGLYEVLFCNREIHNKLNEVLDKCIVPEFCRIARELDIEKLVVSSLSDFSRKYNGETICRFVSDILIWNTKNFTNYITAEYEGLVSKLVRICEYVNKLYQPHLIDQKCHEVCVDFIRSYMSLDPVLAYNDCEYSRKLSSFIKYAVDKLSLPPQMLAEIKKPAPYYGYTQTSAVGLYLLDNSEGKHWEEISALNKPEQEIVMLKQQIVEQDLNSIVMCFSLLKDNPSENYDYLLSEFLHKMSCFDEFLIEQHREAKELFSNGMRLLEIFISRAETQQHKKNGIAAELLQNLSSSPLFNNFFEYLSLLAGGKAAFDVFKKRLSAFDKVDARKYTENTVENMIIGDYREYGLIAMNRGNYHFRGIRKLLTAEKLSGEDLNKLKPRMTVYYRYLLAYDLCNPLKSNKELFENFELGSIGRIKNCIYPIGDVVRGRESDSDKDEVKIPNMKVRDTDYKKDSDRSNEEMKKIEFEKNSDNETIDDEVETSEQHYELKNADKPLHIIGNRKLSEILNDKIIKSLKTDPEKMKKYGMNIVPNFILYGEPGCGKTEAVRQYCEHLGLEPVIINSATVGTSHIHETPVNIHNKFDEAISKKNGVIIIDEADAFLSERDNLRTDDDFKTEEVSAALQGVDQANRNHTQVIAMTNYPEKIDKAILRDGRLGLHIEITNPDETDLEEIIETFFDKSELENLDKTQMVKALNGQTIASVYSIFNGIRMDVVMNDIELTHQYVMHKINSSLGYTLEDGAYFSLPGQQEFEDYVNKNIVHHLLNPDVYRKYNLKFPNSILLYGPTGTGKTYAAKELAKFLGWNFIKLDSKSIGSEAVQGSAIKIAKVFDRARREAPSIIFIDEIDAWIPKRSGRSTNSEIGQVNEFLANMSQVNSDNLLLIGTTNRIDDIDEAALRNGRFSTKIEIGYMKGEQVEELLSSLIKDIPYDDSIDLSEIAKTQDNKSVADIVAFFEKACRFSAENKYDFLTKECFQKAMDTETKKDECRRIGFL